MFYLRERNCYDGIFFLFANSNIFFIFSNVSFKMLESNPLYNKKKPCDLFLFYFYNRFFCFGGALRKELLYERSYSTKGAAQCFNVKFSTYYFHMKIKVLAEFQICISVPLKEQLLFKTPQMAASVFFLKVIK